MTLQQELITRFRKPHERWEGVKLQAYICPAGFLSIGIGHNCVAKPVAGVHKVGDAITPAIVEALYKEDCAEAMAHLDAHLPWWRSLSSARAGVLFDMCFNMGIGFPASAGKRGRGLRSFGNTLAFIQKGDYVTAAKMMEQSAWARQVHRRAKAMIKQMETGIWQV